nr:capsid protein [Ora Rivulet insect-associated polycipivirus]
MNLSEHNKLESNSTPLPEQPSTIAPLINNPRTFQLEDLIRRWQPTGFRVVINLPFGGNDQDYLFLIRPHPYIPYPGDLSRDGNLNIFNMAVWNAFRPVIHGTLNSDISESNISISQHSPPPILSTLATMYRFWRGSLKYRIRAVTNFTTQGYLFYTMLKNTADVPGTYNAFAVQPPINRADTSYLPEMMNNYVSLDLSQMRHAEIQVPFEYPIPFKDTYAEIEHATKFNDASTIATISSGSNLIALGLRGAINSSSTTNQAIFEIEYCAGEDFQFSGENLLGLPFSQSKYSFFNNPDPYAKRVAGFSPFIIPQKLSSDGRDFATIKAPDTNDLPDLK